MHEAKIMKKGPVLLITAHADDAEFFAGGTIAKFAAEGRDVYEIITTNNERGSFEMDSSQLVTDSRDKEANEAARILGKKEIFFLEYPDGFLGDTPLNELREKFMRFIREIRPYTLMTFDPWAPYEPHPDHRAVGMAAVEAAGFAHLPLYHPEHVREGLAPHVTAESYYFAKSPMNAEKFVDIGQFIDKKIDALCAHDCQIKMMVDDFLMSAKACGMESDMLPMMDRNNYRPMLEMFIRQWAQKTGEPAGIEYAEVFRYETANDLIRELMSL